VAKDSRTRQRANATRILTPFRATTTALGPRARTACHSLARLCCGRLLGSCLRSFAAWTRTRFSRRRAGLFHRISLKPGFRDGGNASNSSANWPPVCRGLCCKSADDSSHNRANRAGYAADRRTCYCASCLLRDWWNPDVFRWLLAPVLLWFWMIRHKLSLLNVLDLGRICFGCYGGYSRNEFWNPSGRKSLPPRVRLSTHLEAERS